jgi:hypothetical protein
MHDDDNVKVTVVTPPSIATMKYALQHIIEKETRTLEKLQMLIKLKQEEIEACRKSLDTLSHNNDK